MHKNVFNTLKNKIRQFYLIIYGLFKNYIFPFSNMKFNLVYGFLYMLTLMGFYNKMLIGKYIQYMKFHRI